MELNKKHFAEFFRTDFNTVSVVFMEGLTGSKLRGQAHMESLSDSLKRYTYKVPKSMEVKEGDLLLVCTSNHPEDRHTIEGLKTVKVMSVNNEPEIEGSACFNYKWIVSSLADAMKGYMENVEKDMRLRRAVTKLEAALERVNLRKQITFALEELGPEEAEELRQLFGTDLLGVDPKECSKLEQS